MLKSVPTLEKPVNKYSISNPHKARWKRICRVNKTYFTIYEKKIWIFEPFFLCKIIFMNKYLCSSELNKIVSSLSRTTLGHQHFDFFGEFTQMRWQPFLFMNQEDRMGWNFDILFYILTFFVQFLLNMLFQVSMFKLFPCW